MFIYSMLIFMFLGALLDLQQVPKQPSKSFENEEKSDLTPFKSFTSIVGIGFDLLENVEHSKKKHAMLNNYVRTFFYLNSSSQGLSWQDLRQGAHTAAAVVSPPRAHTSRGLVLTREAKIVFATPA